MPQIYDMGPTALLPLRRKVCCGFFHPKNPTASAGFEPANLGIKASTLPLDHRSRDCHQSSNLAEHAECHSVLEWSALKQLHCRPSYSSCNFVFSVLIILHWLILTPSHCASYIQDSCTAMLQRPCLIYPVNQCSYWIFWDTVHSLRSSLCMTSCCVIQQISTWNLIIFWTQLNPTLFNSRLQLKCDGTRWWTRGEVKGKLANGVGSHYPSHYLGTWRIQHYYRWCAHLGCK